MRKKKKAAEQLVNDYYCSKGVSSYLKRKYKNKCNKKKTIVEETTTLIAQVAAGIEKIDQEIARLTMAAQDKGDAAAVAKTEEELIAALGEQITQKKEEHDLALERHISVEESLSTVNQQKIVVSDEAIQTIKGELDSIEAHHAKLTDPSDGHPLREKLEEAKAGISRVIAAHDVSIDTITNQLADNEDETREIEEGKNVAIAAYDGTLAQLRKAKEELSASSHSYNDQKSAETAKLNATTQEGEAEIEALAEELNASIEGLKADIAKAEAERAVVVQTNQQELGALMDSHAIESNDITTHRDRLQDDKAAASVRLSELMTLHAVA